MKFASLIKEVYILELTKSTAISSASSPHNDLASATFS
jgi:hypothetical protein